jgi:hypothetical protein
MRIGNQLRCLVLATMFIAVPVAADDAVQMASASSLAIDAGAWERAVAESSGTTSLDGYLPPPPTRDELIEKYRLRGPRVAMFSSVGIAVGGLVMFSVADSQCPYYPCDGAPQGFAMTGVSLFFSGIVGIRTRGPGIALYSSMGAFAAGLVIALAADSKCEYDPYYRCDPLPEGFSIAGGVMAMTGLVASLPSAIILLVRNGRIRRDMKRKSNGEDGTLTWDPSVLGLRF